MRTVCLISGCVLGLTACAGLAAAQTVVEYGAAAGAAATAGASAKGLGNSIAGAFDGVGKALKQSQEQAPKTEVVPTSRTTAKPKADAAKDAPGTAAAPAAPAVLRPAYEDAMGIQKGMACEEVTRRFGPPSMSFASEDDATTMSYTSKAGGVQAECVAGKVTSVDKPRI